MSVIEDKLTEILKDVPDALVYINMTDGIEALPLCRKLEIPQAQIRFCSIQSSHLEQKTLDPLIQRLGADMMMDLACGQTCIVIDYGTDKTISRAIYQGIPFIKYCLERNWFNEEPIDVFIQPREYDATFQNVGSVYGRWYHNLDRRTKSFIKKFKNYANAVNQDKIVNLIGISDKTKNDGHPSYYVNLVKKHTEIIAG